MRSWSRAIMPAALAVVLFFGLVGPSHAVDGVLEINQACAVNTGCFAGDAAGFPVTIDGIAGRSYRLTSNLNVFDPNTDGLYLTTSRVTIDFNGFSLVGFSIGSGGANGISGAGTDGAFARFATFKNGVIRGWRARGIALAGAPNVRVQDMTLHLNAGGGITLGDGAMVLKSRFISNGSTNLFPRGVETGERSLIKDNLVSASGGDGILARNNSLISGNVVTGNGGDGIECDDNCVVSGNTVSGNEASGIEAKQGSMVSGNSAIANGVDGIFISSGTVSNNASADNGNRGIRLSMVGNVEGNTVQGNGASGIRLFGTQAGYRANVVHGNAGEAISGDGVNAGSNFCGFPLLPPFIPIC